MADPVVESGANGTDARGRAKNGENSELEGRELHFEIDGRW